ncbi:hypothetical protein [Streptomyces sp. PT12]|uniref:hypothetical protein n=1 Tax=Streptomyces sp. PT12 TaxID=1510197 RepID=UPI000DE1C0E2|nr:hypothetical protein [Streptomyces sp. PT12]RBM23646.1 hypothetical protein DEH69_02365 [Streptomyces sp. PT12]
MGCLFTLQFVGAQLPSALILFIATGLGLALDLTLRRWQPGIIGALGRLHFDEAVRQLLRDLLVVLGIAHLSGIDTVARLLMVGGLLACYAAHFVCRALAVVVRRSRTLPVVTRNIDTAALGLTPAPPRLLLRPAHRMPLLQVPATLGMLLTAVADRAIWGLLGVGISLVLLSGCVAHLATWLLPGKRSPGEERTLAFFQSWLDSYRPDVGIYFSGGSGTAYQANMWLSTLAAVAERPLVVLRERGMVQQIAATDVPVICVPRVAHLMLLERSTLKMLLHPANAPKTSQVLRIPTIKHAFTNHGESDKLSSCNPYAKVYDQVWVAGPAARKRYAVADVGVDDRDVVEVGRPQLAPIRPWAGRPEPGRALTVLYAPTWEGWTNDPGNTSVLLAGENIVRTLLADPRVRLLYKPHPMTGSVNRRAGEADARIRTLIAEANAGTAARAERSDRAGLGARSERGSLATPPTATDTVAAEPARGRGEGAASAEARAELARCTEELNRLTARVFRPGADEMERMMRQSAPEPGRAEAVEAAMEAWRAAFWAAQPRDAHLVLTGSRPDIYSCFNQADLLISDVSSVAADFLASTKPYAVVNTSGLSEADFRAANPTVRAATIITPEAREIPALLAAVADPDLDTLADERVALQTYLLGPSDPPSLTRFTEATRALSAEADARRSRQTRLASGDSGVELPIPRPSGHRITG